MHDYLVPRLRLNSSPSSFNSLGQREATACMQVLVPHDRATGCCEAGLLVCLQSQLSTLTMQHALAYQPRWGHVFCLGCRSLLRTLWSGLCATWRVVTWPWYKRVPASSMCLVLETSSPRQVHNV